MRKTGLDTIYSMAQNNSKIFFIGSDLGIGTLAEFNSCLPNQFLMEGVSESNIIGMASGLAMEGHIVYINTIATFLTRRCLDQIVINLASENLMVRLFASGGGLVYGPLGATHMALDDIALMRSIPNMTILSPADAKEMKALLIESETYPGPMYIRVGRGGEKEIPYDAEIKIGKSIKLLNGKDICFCSTGTMSQIALEVANQLIDLGISIEFLHYPTIVPFDIESFKKSVEKVKRLYVFEEHFEKGGFFGEIAEQLTHLMPIEIKVKHFSAGNSFISKYGRQFELLQVLGLDSVSILKSIKLDLGI